jgi:hypothetical protein
LALDEGEWSTPRPGRFTSGKDPVPIVFPCIIQGKIYERKIGVRCHEAAGFRTGTLYWQKLVTGLLGIMEKGRLCIYREYGVYNMDTL